MIIDGTPAPFATYSVLGDELTISLPRPATVLVLTREDLYGLRVRLNLDAIERGEDAAPAADDGPFNNIPADDLVPESFALRRHLERSAIDPVPKDVPYHGM